VGCMTLVWVEKIGRQSGKGAKGCLQSVGGFSLCQGTLSLGVCLRLLHVCLGHTHIAQLRFFIARADW
jgi:hypothetical protein